MKRFFILVIGCVFMVTGCVTPMTKQEISSAKYDQLPTNYQETLKNIIAYTLKDSDSAKYKFHKPRLAYTPASRNVAYVVPVDVNAKNSYGGYTGYKTKYYVYIGGKYKDVTAGVHYTAVKWVDEVME
ncbi:hypothetical protein [Xenorhabdus griffiniae]|uniref:Lipoprotein n=1 Tax=Xenorhabdus griffiniae TaxID=351672 RepID=A0ABY9XKS6_9GAMM|nr:hypothetical protein [Xenorhabdus griffiniae]MBD1228651.1 hypothetical protein [Xenorhabdus griffiniae]MBE8588199.1 hypothetical protein [Xenorhabdus griffiniae]WMV73544.1 hypothetical protein QL128_05850 [Xenorhabdus griffiniae]WNH03224.1 hypothetical protein QL112_005855 [Xenorhabdus griffiniae]